MSLTNTITAIYTDNAAQVSNQTTTYTGTLDPSFDGTIAAGTTNKQIPILVNIAALQSYCLKSDQAITLTPVLPHAIGAPAAATGSTATTGGTVLAGVYGIVVTYVNASGETVASAAGSVTTTGSTSTLTVNSPASVTGATGWYAYVTQAGGTTYTRQQAAGSPTAIATPLTLTAPPTSTGAVPQIVNTTGGTGTPVSLAAGVSQLYPSGANAFTGGNFEALLGTNGGGTVANVSLRFLTN